MHSTKPTASALENRVLSTVLVLAGLSACITMLFHPSGYDPEHIETTTWQFSINAHVHGLMITYGLILSACIVYFFSTRVNHKALNIFTMVFYLAGSVAMIGAALVNGFLFPEYVVHLDAGLRDNAELYRAMMRHSWNTNQVLASFGAYCWSASLVFGSLSLVCGTTAERLVGIAFTMIGLSVLIALAANWIDLNVAGMTTVMGSQGLWYFAIAFCLTFGSNSRRD